MLASTYPHMPVSVKWVKKEIHDYISRLWQEEWVNRADCKISKLFIPLVSTSKQTHIMSLNELHNLSMIMTGHGLYKKHLRHWNELDDLTCCL